MMNMLLEHSYSFCNGNRVFTNTVILEAVATALNMIFVDRTTTFHLPVFGVPRCHLKGISRLVCIKRYLLLYCCSQRSLDIYHQEETAFFPIEDNFTAVAFLTTL